MKYGKVATARSDCWIGNFSTHKTPTPTPAFLDAWEEIRRLLAIRGTTSWSDSTRFKLSAPKLVVEALGKQHQQWYGSGRRFHVWEEGGIFLIAHTDAGISFENIPGLDYFTVLAQVKAWVTKIIEYLTWPVVPDLAPLDYLRIKDNAFGWGGKVGQITELSWANPEDSILWHGGMTLHRLSDGKEEHFVVHNWQRFAERVLPILWVGWTPGLAKTSCIHLLKEYTPMSLGEAKTFIDDFLTPTDEESNCTPMTIYVAADRVDTFLHVASSLGLKCEKLRTHI